MSELIKTPPHFAHLQDKLVTIVALGDSNTEVNWWTLGGLNWFGLLGCNLYETFINGKMMINSGISGSSVPHSMERLNRDVLRFNPDVVIVSLGLNDARNCDPEGFEKQYSELINAMLARGIMVITRTPNPIINMADGTEMCTWTANGSPPVSYMMQEYSVVIVNLSKELGCICIDHYSQWKKSLASKYHGEMSMLMGNHMHPNAVGHKRFYYELAPVFGLSPYFQHDFEHLLYMEGALCNPCK